VLQQAARILTGPAADVNGKRQRGSVWPLLPPLIPRHRSELGPEAYLFLGAFLASFCLLCFWVFFGLLSPILCSFRRLLYGSVTSRPAC